MKNVILVVVILILQIKVIAGDGNIGIIRVNENVTATLIFEDKIDFVVFGNNPVADNQNGEAIYENYDIFKRNNLIIIKPVKTNPPTTNIIVGFEEGEIKQGIVKVDNEVKNAYHDFRKMDDLVNHNIEKLDETVKRKDDVKRKVENVIEERDKYNTIGLRNSGIVYKIGNMRADNYNIYIKLTIFNNSGVRYNIDGITFRFQEMEGRIFGRSEDRLTERIVPAYFSEIERIRAYSKETVGYAIPIYSVGSKGYLVVNIIEKQGARNVQIRVPANKLLNVAVFREEQF